MCRYVKQKKGLNSDIKMILSNLPYMLFLTEGCHHGAGFLLGDDTSLKKTDQFVANLHIPLEPQCYLPCACAQCTHGADEFPAQPSRSEASFLGAQTFAKRSIVSRFT